MEEYVTLELNGTEKGWNCSGCGCFTPAFGRPTFGQEQGVELVVKRDNTNWFTYKPGYRYCPGCGKKVKNQPEDD